MKKQIALVLALALVLSVTACTAPEIEEAAPNAMIPMVMVDGVIYMTTGYESTATERRDGFDGEISSTVGGHEQPTENDQSNFGTGFGYQYGQTEGTLELYINGKWWIYGTQEARDRMFYPERYRVIDEPPAFALIYGETRINPRTGSFSWNFTQDDGTELALCGDGLHPLTEQALSPCVALTQDAPLEIWLHWDIMPDLVEVRCWEEASWEQLEAEPKEAYRLMEGNETGDCFLLRPKNGNYIYEVVATWQNAPNFGGTVYYSFHTEK